MSATLFNKEENRYSLGMFVCLTAVGFIYISMSPNKLQVGCIDSDGNAVF